MSNYAGCPGCDAKPLTLCAPGCTYADAVKEVAANSEVERLKDILHTDRSGLAAALEEVWRTAGGYAWVAESRGCYEWDDPEYRREMARMVRAISTICQTALETSGNLAHAECCGRGRGSGRET